MPASPRLVLLTVLEKADDDLYGYQIAKQLQQVSPALGLKQGVLYPVLRAMSANGLLVEPRGAVVCRTTPSLLPHHGSRASDAAPWQSIWRETRAFVDVFIEPRNEEPREEQQ